MTNRQWQVSARSIGPISLIGLISFLGLPAVTALADSLLTPSGRTEGAMEVREGQLVQAGAPVVFDSVLLAVRDSRGHALSDPDRVRLRSGEVWSCRAESYRNGTLIVRNSFRESLSVGIAELASIEFAVNLAAPGIGQVGVLERRQGEPVRGKLVWFNDRDLAVDGPLGLITIGRHEALRYVAEALPEETLAQGTDAIGLADGSIYYGKAALSDNGLRLEHALAGSLDIPWSTVRFLQRNTAGIAWLVKPDQQRVIEDGMVVPPPPPEVVDYRRSLQAAQGGLKWLRTVRLFPGDAARFVLPGPATHYRASVVPTRGSSGPVTLSIWAGKQKKVEQVVGPGAEPVEVAFEIPTGALDLMVRALPVADGSIPAGLELCDGFVELRTGKDDRTDPTDRTVRSDR